MPVPHHSLPYQQPWYQQPPPAYHTISLGHQQVLPFQKQIFETIQHIIQAPTPNGGEGAFLFTVHGYKASHFALWVPSMMQVKPIFGGKSIRLPFFKDYAHPGTFDSFFGDQGHDN